MVSRYEIMENSLSINSKKEIASLPTETYFMYVPKLATLDDDEINNYGIPQVGFVDDLQTNPLDEIVLVKWSIGMMLTGFKNGYRISFHDGEDIHRVNEAINEYFDNIDSLLKHNSPNNITIETDLQALDEFNKSIYENNTGKILNKRKEIIERFSFEGMFPGLIHREVDTISNLKPSTPNGEIQGRYTVFESSDETSENPLAPVYKEENVFDLSNLEYVNRYEDVYERKIEEEFNKTKQKIKDNQW